MNLLRALPAIALIAALGVGVTFAHSESKSGVIVYGTQGFFASVVGRASCRLNVTKTDGGLFEVWPPSFTTTHFKGIWPTVAGELEFPVAQGQRGDEFLKITFEKKGEVIQPVGYTWTAPSNDERSACQGLVLKN